MNQLLTTPPQHNQKIEIIDFKTDGLYVSVETIQKNYMGGTLPIELLRRYSNTVGNPGILYIQQIENFFEVHHSEHGIGLDQALSLSKFMGGYEDLFQEMNSVYKKLYAEIGGNPETILNPNDPYSSAFNFINKYREVMVERSSLLNGRSDYENGSYWEKKEKTYYWNIAVNICRDIMYGLLKIQDPNLLKFHTYLSLNIANRPLAILK